MFEAAPVVTLGRTVGLKTSNCGRVVVGDVDVVCGFVQGDAEGIAGEASEARLCGSEGLERLSGRVELGDLKTLVGEDVASCVEGDAEAAGGVDRLA